MENNEPRRNFIMKINTMKKMILLSTLALFTACVDQNNINVTKEKEMREEATLDISKMPLQTYEEYIKVKKFVLEKYIQEANNTRSSGVAYLNDGTKIKYYFDSKDVAETITHKKRPFIRIIRMYYPDSKNIKIDRIFIANLLTKKTIIYNKFGEISKVYDNESEYISKGLNYKKLLEGAEKQGFIDLKEGKMLKGDSFKIAIRERTEKDPIWSREEKEEFAEETGLSYNIIDDFKKDKYYWRFDIEYSDRTEMYNFTRNGIFVNHLMTSRIMRY